MRRAFDRRSFLTLLAAGSAAALAGCGRPAAPPPAVPAAPPDGGQPLARGVATSDSPQATVTQAATSAPPTPTSSAPADALPRIPPPRPGPPQVFSELPASAGRSIALTIDDGYDRETVAAYVQFATDSGLPIMFDPNGVYAAEWAPHAKALAPLIAAGQVQIGNHTYTHADLRRLRAPRIREELERNDAWIVKTFGVTSRPWYRPPYGFHNKEIDVVAGACPASRRS